MIKPIKYTFFFVFVIIIVVFVVVVAMEDKRYHAEKLVDMLDPNSMGSRMIQHMLYPERPKLVANIDVYPEQILAKGIVCDDITNGQIDANDEALVWEYYPPLLSKCKEDKVDEDELAMICTEGMMHLNAIKSHYLFNVNGTCADTADAILIAYDMQQSNARSLEEYFNDDKRIN